MAHITRRSSPRPGTARGPTTPRRGIRRGESIQAGDLRATGHGGLAPLQYVGEEHGIGGQRAGDAVTDEAVQEWRRDDLVQGLRRWLLATRDAHGLYRQFGFQELKDPATIMEAVDTEVYVRASRPR
jgi:hypothetical protein